MLAFDRVISPSFHFCPRIKIQISRGAVRQLRQIKDFDVRFFFLTASRPSIRIVPIHTRLSACV